MSWLIDTAVLVRLANVSDPLHDKAVGAIAELFEREQELYVTPQNLIEFWSVATRPASANGGLGLPAASAAEIVNVFQAEFALAPETADLFPTLRRLLDTVAVVGKQVHDARLVASCRVHAIRNVLTFNVRHFVRFAALPPGLTVVEPGSVSAHFAP